MQLRRFCPVTPILIFLAAIFAFSCNTGQQQQDAHPAYFDSVFRRAEVVAREDGNAGVTYVDSCFSRFPDAGIKDLCRKYEYHINHYLDDDPQNPMAMVYADSMFWVLGRFEQDPAFEKEYLNALLLKGSVLFVSKEYASAFQYNYKARQVAERMKDSCMLSRYTYTLGGICYKQEKYLEAIHYYLQAIRESKHCPWDYKQFTMTQGRLNDIGFAYMKSNMPDSALHYFNADLDYLDEHVNDFSTIVSHRQFTKMAKGIVYGNLGDVYLAKGDTAAAERSYKTDSNIGGRAGYDVGDGQCTQLKIVNLYLSQKRLTEAGQELNTLRASLDRRSGVDNEIKWLRLMIAYLELTGHTERSYDYVKPYMRLRDSLASVKPVPQVDLAKGYEQIKDRYNMELLAHENEHKNYYLAVVLAASLLAIIIAMILWYSWKQSRKMNDAITRRNNETGKRNNELKLALESLTASEQRNTRVMKIVAHDLKNPVASIISIASIIQDNNKLNEEDRELLGLIRTSGENSIEMITDILNINSDATALVKEPAQVHDLLRYCIDLLQVRATEKGQHITLHTEDATLSMNKEKMWRVISNLIVNAIKFSPENAAIDISGSKKQGNFVIEVRDHGIGIPPEMIEQVFEMFTDARRPGTAGEQSFGLGLAISRQIVEAHGGRLWCESEIGKGTVFFISLPA